MVISFRLWPTLLTLIMLVGLVSLGVWQVQRLHWKEQLLADIAAHAHDSPVDVVQLTDPQQTPYRPATASGIFHHDKELYLTAISLKGEGGYHVLTPLELTDGRFLLVDRGWIPYDHKSPATRHEGQPAGTVTVTGLTRAPERHGFHPTNDPAQNMWYSIDLPAMAQAAGIKAFLPFVLDADAMPNPSGYPLGGQTRMTLPNNHFVYAVTWFSLAAALIVIYGFYTLRKRA